MIVKETGSITTPNRSTKAGNFRYSLSDTGDKYESAIAGLDSYFMPKKNLIYKHYNFLSAQQNSAKNIDVYVKQLQLLKKSCDYGSFKEEMIRDHFVMSCDSCPLWPRLLQEKDLSLKLLQTIVCTVELSDHQA